MGNEVEVRLIGRDELSPVVQQAAQTVDQYTRSINASGTILDQYGRAVTRTSGALDRHSEAGHRASQSANALERQWGKLTSGTDFLAAGVMRLRGMLSAIAWGTAIGAAAALTGILIEQARAWLTASGELEKYKQKVREAENVDREKLEIFKAQKLLLFDQIVAQRDYVTELERRGATMQFIDGETRRLRDLQAQYGALSQEIKRLSGVETETERQAREHREVQRQEGWNIVNAARVQLAERERLERDHGAVQEVIGRQIVEAELARQKGLILSEGEKGRIIAANARAEWEATQWSEQKKTEARQAGLNAAVNLANALYTFSQGKSRALFRLWQIAAISEATVNSYAAFTAALKGPPGPPWSVPIAAAALAQGLAAVARISATSFGGGGGGGGIGGGGGGGIPVSFQPGPGVSAGSLAQNNPPPPLNVTIIIQGNLVGNEEYIHENLIPAIEEASRNERSNLALKGP
ncbi:MAG TPA: hypothetical protein VIL61_09120 [Nitrospiria bacterium]